MDQQNIDTQFKGIGSVLRSDRVSVPKYQRSYAWLQEEVDQFFEDIDRAMATHEPEYFLGSAVFSRSKGHFEIIDGQQRLTTSSIALAAIRAWLILQNDSESTDRAGLIAQEYLFSKDLETLEIIPKLTLGENDHEFYSKAILGGDKSLKPSRDSHKRLLNAYKTSTQWIENISSTKGDETESALIKWTNYIRDSAKLIIVIVPDHANAFRIFETLNARGRDLTIFDLIKNYLFSQTGSQIQLAIAGWAEIQSNLDPMPGQDKHSDFLRHTWSASHGLTREKELFKVIQNNAGNSSQAISTIEQLKKSSRKYADIVNCNTTSWDGYNNSFNQSLTAIKVTGVEMVRPLVLAMTLSLRPSLSMKCIRYVVDCVVRSSVVGGNRRMYETRYAEIAKDISAERLVTADQIKNELKNLAPNDTEFKNAFASHSVANAAFARYILQAIEKHASSKEELTPEDNPEILNLEHILPKIKGNEWPGFDDETHKAYRNRIGNQCLLLASHNSKIGNTPFDDKKEILKKSLLITTNVIAEFEEWTIEAIESRQRNLADHAVATWSFA